MKTLEVELRGPLDSRDFSRLMSYLDKNGKHTGSQERLFFDLSQTIGINNRELDVRVKVTNHKIQIVVKKGLAGSVGRNEVEIEVKDKSLKETLRLLSLLGYPKGVYGDRKIERYQVGRVEFAIQDIISVKDGSLYGNSYEAEILTENDDRVEAEKELRDLLLKIGLGVYDTEGWDVFEAKINSEANGWFVFGETDISRFEKTHE
jgi:adenylate cyclase class IV